jgi:DNA-binding transcriptional MerR regulator
MRIGELARRSRVDARLLRYYERQGLLQPRRGGNGYREYTEADIVAVQHIRSLLAAGLSTATIAELQHCLRGSDVPTPACAGVTARLRAERARIETAIDRLLDARATLDQVIDRGADAPVKVSGDPDRRPPIRPGAAVSANLVAH